MKAVVMSWKSTTPMNERIKFIARYLAREETVTELCEEFGISRKSGYKWIERYNEGGAEALAERSRAPLTHPHAYPDEVVASLVALRQGHETWGARKLLAILRRRHPELALPAPSTVNEMLSKRGLLKRRRPKRRSSKYSEPLRVYSSPNAVWCADFKGHFEVAERRCHPLTITDGYSRFLLGCEALAQPTTVPTQKVFERVFREYGLPDVIRTDNGTPFSTLTIAGLSPLAVWWLRLGILPERILPGRPDQNGRHERMHRTLKAEATRPPSSSFRAQQRRFDDFREAYNYERPHEAIGQRFPAELYKRSLRRFPSRLPEFDYPEHFVVERAYSNGHVRLNNITWYVSTAVANELIGFEPLGEKRWRVYCGKLALGVIDSRHTRALKHERAGRTLPLDGFIWDKQKKKRQRQ